MAMRPWGYALALGLAAGVLAGALATDAIPDRASSLPAPPMPPEREVTRGTDGAATGSDDGGVLRGTDGALEGSVRRNPAGLGSTSRATDGRLLGLQPERVPVQRFQPR